MSTPAGWYPSGGDDGSLRWWDGEMWTRHVRSDTAAALSGLERAVSTVEERAGTQRCVLALRWEIDPRSAYRVDGVPTGLWDLRSSTDVFATMEVGPIDSSAVTATSRWGIVSHRGWGTFWTRRIAAFTVVDLDTDTSLGPHRNRAGGVTFGNAPARTDAYDWGKVGRLSTRGWRFDPHGVHGLTVTFMQCWPSDASAWEVAKRRWSGRYATTVDVELAWVPPLPGEAALLCCLGLRLLMIPRPLY